MVILASFLAREGLDLDAPLTLRATSFVALEEEVVELELVEAEDVAALVLADAGGEAGLALLLADADFEEAADDGAFLEKKENKFFCFGGGLLDFAIVMVYEIRLNNGIGMVQVNAARSAGIL